VNSTGPVTPGAIGKLAVGEDNSDPGGDFPIVCQMDMGVEGVDAAAKWMWYASAGGDAFHFSSLDATRPFLIFRLAAKNLPAGPK
jgi:hypothetical protein